MDALDKMISDKRAEAENLRGRIRVLEAELAALELAAQLRPATKGGVGGKASRHGGGRRPGDISKDWRQILARVYATGAPVGYEQIMSIAAELGNNLADSSVRDRVRNMVKTGLMAGNAKDGFFVTEDAAERFSFAKENEPPEGGSETEEVTASSNPGGIPGMFTYAPQAADPAPHSGGEGGD
ncbi:MAG: hypothetical protein ACOCYW_06795 [Roseicyclus sp.]